MKRGPLSTAVGAWNRFWFAEFDPHGLGVFRIALGVLLVVFLVACYPSWDRFFAADGVLSLVDLDPDRATADRWNVFYWTESLCTPLVWWFVATLAAVCFTLGLETRLATIVLYVLVVSMIHRTGMITNGEDFVFRMLLFYSCFAPLGRALSLDSALRERRGAAALPPPRIWAVRLAQINVALVYAISMPYKLADDVAWTDGTAIYWAMTSNLWSRWPWPELFYGGLLSAIFSYGTILVEGAFPLFVWFRRTKMPVIIALAGLHVGIALFLQNVTFFSLSMVCALVLFVPPELTRAWASRLPGRTE